MPRKERILGILVNSEAKAYCFQDNGNNIDLISIIVGGKSITVIYSKSLNIITAYESVLEDGSIVTITSVQNKFPTIMIDTDGNKYNLFKEVSEGLRRERKLKSLTSMVAYWFA